MILITVILVVEVPWRSGSFPLAGDPVSSHVNFLTAANLKSVIRPRWESIYFVKKKIWNFLCAESNWTVSNFRFHFHCGKCYLCLLLPDVVVSCKLNSA